LNALHPLPQGLGPWPSEIKQIDQALYAAVAATHTPRLDWAMPRLSQAANYSRLSVAAAALLAIAGGSTGRRAAGSGLASVAATSASVNLVVKYLGRRPRPDRTLEDVPVARRLTMPATHSFPSGHAAAAVAFASGAGRVLPVAGFALYPLAALVAYSRVHTGVHYPADVIAGALSGALIADLTTSAIKRTRARRLLEGS
jgi:membrane-associated phospholipid phosphatase